MEIDGGGGDGAGASRRYLPKVAHPILREGIEITLTRWSALQMAVDFEWGGRNSRLRAEQLIDEIFDWFTRSKDLFVDDLEDMLQSCMLSLNTMTEDGSIEEVAENLMILHDECLKGNYKYVENLSKRPRPAAGSHVKQTLNDDEDSDSDEEDDERQRGRHQSNMMDEEKPLPNSSSGSAAMSVDGPSAMKSTETEDGWTTVSSSRKKKSSRHVVDAPQP